MIKEAYKAGAEELLAIEIDEYDDDYENTGKLIVRVPLESAARKRVFQWCAKQAKAQGFNGEKDEGQTHIFVSLDSISQCAVWIRPMLPQSSERTKPKRTTGCPP